ncbi:glycosyltransferase [Mycobacterium sp.]|uniref:glycosyltransferase n=2 Tax=Mycobacterium sp. TaxID=1785 RepID=UPI003F9E76A3
MEMERDVVLTRLPAPLRGGDADRQEALRIALVGTFPPTQCGLATFTESMVRSISHAGRAVQPVVIRLIQRGEPTGGAARATVDWIAGDAASLHRVRDTVEDAGVVILQHEYGIYGGPDGDEVLDLLRTTTTPRIAVLHTVLADPTPHQRAVLEEIIELADVTVTQTEAARLRLRNYAINDPERVIVIPHGAWTEPGTGEQRHHHDKPLVLSWGLLGPGKGLEHGVAAMARLGDLTPTPTYLIAGETHPKVRSAQGERYREMLARSAVELGIADRVVFDGTYRPVSSLAALIRSADVVLLPYDSRDQVTSGVLVEALAAGKPVVATRFPHAVEALASGAGLLVRHGDDEAMADALRRILARPDLAHAMHQEAARVGAGLRWPVVAKRYLAVIDDVLARRMAA